MTTQQQGSAVGWDIEEGALLEFYRTLAHDIRNPLHNILLNTECLLDDLYGDLSQEQKDVITDIRQAAVLVTGLANTLIVEHNIEHGRCQCCLSDLDLVAIVRDGVFACRDKAACLKVIIDADIPDGARFVRSDRDKLQVAVINILSTAVRFAEKGRITIALADNKIVVSGALLDPSDSDRLAGRIVNLAVAQQCIDAIGGTITFDNDSVTITI